MSEKKRSPKKGPKLSGGGRDARKSAALVLEVLAGSLHPSEAAQALGVALPRYYQIEKQALEGLIKGCEPVPKGPKPEARVAVLERRIKQLERDLARYQALARTSQKVLGTPPQKTTRTGRKRRSPVVRALKIAQGIRTDDAAGVTIETKEPDRGG